MGVSGPLQIPSRQMRPAGQLFRHDPQWFPSVFRLKHPSGQLVRPAPQERIHWPYTHTRPASHSFPQYPQFLLSVIESMQVLLHFSLSEGQMTGFSGLAVVAGIIVVGIMVVVCVMIIVVGIMVGFSVSTTTYELPPEPVCADVGRGISVVTVPENRLLPVMAGYPMKTAMRPIRIRAIPAPAISGSDFPAGAAGAWCIAGGPDSGRLS